MRKKLIYIAVLVLLCLESLIIINRAKTDDVFWAIRVEFEVGTDPKFARAILDEFGDETVILRDDFHTHWYWVVFKGKSYDDMREIYGKFIDGGFIAIRKEKKIEKADIVQMLNKDLGEKFD